MPLLSLKSLPRDECLIEAAGRYPDLNPTACAAVLHLLRTGDEVFRVIDEHFAANGLSEGRFSVLMMLGRCASESINCGAPKTTTPAELAEFSGVTRATMTGLIDTLERDGLVSRVPDPQDRRMMNVNITEKGHTLTQSILPEHFRRISAVMSALTAEEQSQLQALLAKVMAKASTLGNTRG